MAYIQPDHLNDIEKIYQKYYDPAKWELRKMGCSSYDFKDFYQEAFLVILEKNRISGDPVRSPQSYFIKICKNIWSDEMKRSGKY